MNYYLSINYEKEHSDLRKKWNRLKQFRKKYLRRLGYFRKIYLYNMQPAWMVLSCLPVLPPDLRPVTKLGGQIFISDIRVKNRHLSFFRFHISHLTVPPFCMDDFYHVLLEFYKKYFSFHLFFIF